MIKINSSKLVIIKQKYKLHNKIKDLDYLNYNNLYSCKSFTTIKKIITNKNFLKKVDEFLLLLNKFYKKYNYFNNSNSNINRKLLTIFIINFNDSLIFQNNIEYNKQLINYSKIILNILSDFKKGYNNFLKLHFYIELYIHFYNKWEVIDKRINTYKLLLDYYNNAMLLIKLDKKSPNYQMLLENLIIDKNNIYYNVKYMNSKSEINYFDKHKSNINHSKFIQNELFWNDVKYELSKTNYDINLILYLLDKTKFLLKSCVPNNKKILDEIDTNIDIDFFKNYLENNIIDNDYFMKLIVYICEKICSFQSKSEDESLELFVEKIKNKANNNIKYKDLLPMFFKEIFRRLENIIKQKQIFMDLLKKK